jgi:hypothetical protein
MGEGNLLVEEVQHGFLVAAEGDVPDVETTGLTSHGRPDDRHGGLDRRSGDLALCLQFLVLLGREMLVADWRDVPELVFLLRLVVFLLVLALASFTRTATTIARRARTSFARARAFARTTTAAMAIATVPAAVAAAISAGFVLVFVLLLALFDLEVGACHVL